MRSDPDANRRNAVDIDGEGRIVEHRDAIREILEMSANDSGMY